MYWREEDWREEVDGEHNHKIELIEMYQGI